MSPFICIERHNLQGLRTALATVDINILSPSGKGLLHSAAGKSGSIEMAAELIRRGIDLNHQDEDGSTALLIATVWKRRDVAEAILEAGGRVDISDKHGNQPLWYAIFDPHCDYEMIELLLRWGANLQHRNNFGKSPLDLAQVKNIGKDVRILSGKIKAAEN